MPRQAIVVRSIRLLNSRVLDKFTVHTEIKSPHFLDPNDSSTAHVYYPSIKYKYEHIPHQSNPPFDLDFMYLFLKFLLVTKLEVLNLKHF